MTTDDIVARLRSWIPMCNYREISAGICEAAEEIERLRESCNKVHNELRKLKRNRDAWHKELREIRLSIDRMRDIHLDMLDEAIRKIPPVIRLEEATDGRG